MWTVHQNQIGQSISHYEMSQAVIQFLIVSASVSAIRNFSVSTSAYVSAILNFGVSASASVSAFFNFKRVCVCVCVCRHGATRLSADTDVCVRQALVHYSQS